MNQADFRKKLLSFVKPTESKTFSIYDPLGKNFSII